MKKIIKSNKIGVFSPMVASVGAAFLLGAAAPAVLAENPFEAKPLTSGYQLADASKAEEGKCGEAKCGGDAKADKEGQCGEGTKAHKEGACGEDAEKAKEGKCGEGKCGGDKAEG